MKRLLFLALMFLFKLNDCNAQNTKIDSLQNLLSTAKEDTNKVNILYKISEECAEEDILKYAIPALKLAEKLNFKKGIADASNNVGYAYAGFGNVSRALEYYYKSLKIREEIRDKEGIAGSLNNIAVIYNNQGDVLKALEYHHKSIKAQEDIGNKEGVATSLNNIGFIYKNQGNTSKALDYYFKSLKMYEEIGDKEGIATSYNNISALYESQGDFPMAFKYDQKSLKVSEEAGNKFGIARSLNNIGLYYSHQGDIPRAFEYYQKSLRMHEEIGNKTSVSTLLKNIAQLYKLQGNFSKAIEYYSKSLKIQEEVGDKRLIAALLNELGNIDLKQKNYKQAAAYCKRSLQIGQNIGNPERIRDASGNLSEIYSVQGKYKEAYQMHVLFKQMADSVSNVETRKSTVKKEMQYEFDKKEAVAKAEQERRDAETKRIKNIQDFTIGALGIIVLAVVIIAFIQYRNNEQKKKANLLLQQQKEKVESTLTELKATQAQLIQSEKMASLGQLTAGIAHEIQNPLNFVNNFSEVSNEMLDEMKEELATGNQQEAIVIADDLKQNLEKIIHHGKRADAIVKGMLQHSRVSTGQKESTDINVLADQYLRLSYHGMRAKDKTFNATLETNFGENVGKINIVPQDIGRVLLNLFNNSFYSMVQKKNLSAPNSYEPTVSLSTKKVEGKIEIYVHDNGVGIPQKVVDKIFQPFFTTKPTGQG
ncbi:MAG TPA: tetratricopeptide repeat protein, partial [Chitinophagaceae bacterium]|nr:tetratricopeptide repeat protein [Chitinophagaceae bacterium]